MESACLPGLMPIQVNKQNNCGLKYSLPRSPKGHLLIAHSVQGIWGICQEPTWACVRLSRLRPGDGMRIAEQQIKTLLIPSDTYKAFAPPSICRKFISLIIYLRTWVSQTSASTELSHCINRISFPNPGPKWQWNIGVRQFTLLCTCVQRVQSPSGPDLSLEANPHLCPRDELRHEVQKGSGMWEWLSSHSHPGAGFCFPFSWCPWCSPNWLHFVTLDFGLLSGCPSVLQSLPLQLFQMVPLRHPVSKPLSQADDVLPSRHLWLLRD